MLVGLLVRYLGKFHDGRSTQDRTRSGGRIPDSQLLVCQATGYNHFSDVSFF
jgi:hypothetical protein